MPELGYAKVLEDEHRVDGVSDAVHEVGHDQHHEVKPFDLRPFQLQ